MKYYKNYRVLCHIINTYQLRAYIYSSSDLKFSAGSMENNNYLSRCGGSLNGSS